MQRFVCNLFSVVSFNSILQLSKRYSQVSLSVKIVSFVSVEPTSSNLLSLHIRKHFRQTATYEQILSTLTYHSATSDYFFDKRKRQEKVAGCYSVRRNWIVYSFWVNFVKNLENFFRLSDSCNDLLRGICCSNILFVP